MAGVVDKIRKKNRQQSSPREWTNTGSFMNKPARGWLHPDEQLMPDAGVCYGVRYIGCMEVKQSMKTLDFDTRTAVAKESISRVCDSAGLKTASKKSKRSTKITRLLADQPNMLFAGSNVNLTITTDNLMIMVMESAEVIACHQMPGISFASGGDAETMDFVAYVAKDEMNGRACHVLECGGGLAQDVITTIGQAFELRFKQYLANRPEAVSLPSRLDEPIFDKNGDPWGDEEDYYNDKPGAMPPSPPLPPTYSVPTSNLPVSDGVYNSVRDTQRQTNLIDLDDDAAYDNSESKGAFGGVIYDNPTRASVVSLADRFDSSIYDNKKKHARGMGGAFGATSYGDFDGAMGGASAAASGTSPHTNGHVDPFEISDPFDMQPFGVTLPDYAAAVGEVATDTSDNSPYHEEWFHGKITRQQCEEILGSDGDFLVRESSGGAAGQFVLSGRQSGRVKHLLLVDPEGVVRTKDRTFESVSHLINFHMEHALPITSNDSELLLRVPMAHSTS